MAGSICWPWLRLTNQTRNGQAGLVLSASLPDRVNSQSADPQGEFRLTVVIRYAILCSGLSRDSDLFGKKCMKKKESIL